jgi:peptidyl-prolyl cis-trans isomerase B (cyclophilin B)
MKKFMLILTTCLCAATLIYSCSNKVEKTTKMESTTQTNTSENPRYEITVTQKGKEMGKILIEIFAKEAPKHAANFDNLVSSGAYDGTAFHRVIPGFMIQGGDPNSKNQPKETWGFGDPKQPKVQAEFSKTMSHNRGIISAARSQDPNSASSQFFVCVADAKFLDGQYSIFGKVITGMEVADKVVNSPRDSKDNPIDKIEMKIIKLKK